MDDPVLRVLASAGLFACSGFASGATLGLFRVSRLRLEIEKRRDDKPAEQARARRLDGLRKDSNLLLASLLVLNVAVNEAQPLVHPHGGPHDSTWVAGALAWTISFFGVLVFGEAIPLAFANKRRVDTPLVYWLVRLVTVITWPIARPLASILDRTVGREVMQAMQERDLIEAIRILMGMDDSEISATEGGMAIQCLRMDELYPTDIGSPVHPSSIIPLPIAGPYRDDDHYEIGRPQWPEPTTGEWDAFVRKVRDAKKDGVGLKWIVITNQEGRVNCLLHRQDFLEAVYDSGAPDIGRCCHLPIVVCEHGLRLGEILPQFAQSMALEDYDNVVLYWNGDKVILTGTDIQRELLKGVASRTQKKE